MAARLVPAIAAHREVGLVRQRREQVELTAGIGFVHPGPVFLLKAAQSLSDSTLWPRFTIFSTLGYKTDSLLKVLRRLWPGQFVAGNFASAAIAPECCCAAAFSSQ